MGVILPEPEPQPKPEPDSSSEQAALPAAAAAAAGQAEEAPFPVPAPVAHPVLAERSGGAGAAATATSAGGTCSGPSGSGFTKTEMETPDLSPEGSPGSSPPHHQARRLPRPLGNRGIHPIQVKRCTAGRSLTLPTLKSLQCS